MNEKETKVKKASTWRTAYDLIFDSEERTYKIVALEYNLDNKDAVVTKEVSLTHSLALAVDRMERLTLAKLTERPIKEKWFEELTQKENK